MNILACIKQVPDTEAQIKIDSGGKGIQTADIKWVMNPYDEFGVEEALRLKEKAGRREGHRHRLRTSAGGGISAHRPGHGGR